MNERYIQFHLDVSEIADKLNEVMKEHALVDYHILKDEKTINKYYLIVGVSPLNKPQQFGNGQHGNGNIVLL